MSLAGNVVDGGEVDQLLAIAVDGHRLGHDVDLARLDGVGIRSPFGTILKRMSVGRAEDGLAHLAGPCRCRSRTSCPVLGSRYPHR